MRSHMTVTDEAGVMQALLAAATEWAHAQQSENSLIQGVINC